MDKKYIEYIATVMITIVISMTGFWMMMGRNYITRAEANVIAEEKMHMIDNKLDLYLKREEKFEKLIGQNTDAINEFRVSNAALNQTLIYLKEQIEKASREANKHKEVRFNGASFNPLFSRKSSC